MICIHIKGGDNVIRVKLNISFHCVKLIVITVTIKNGTSAKRIECDRFNSGPKRATFHKTLKLVLTLRGGGTALARNRRNSLPLTVRNSRQRACNQSFFCLQ